MNSNAPPDIPGNKLTSGDLPTTQIIVEVNPVNTPNSDSQPELVKRIDVEQHPDQLQKWDNFA